MEELANARESTIAVCFGPIRLKLADIIPVQPGRNDGVRDSYTNLAIIPPFMGRLDARGAVVVSKHVPLK